MGLLELPPEMFSLIVDAAVSTHGLALAMTMRLVCKTFEDEIVRSVYRTQALEDKRSERLHIRGRTSVEYLLALVLSDRDLVGTRFSPVIQPIRDVVKFILLQSPKLKDRKVDFARRLSELALHRPFYFAELRYPFDTLSERPYSISESALAATTYLGLTSCARELALWGILPTITSFSHPYVIAIERRNTELQHLFRHELEVWRSEDFPYQTAVCAAVYSGDVDTLRFLVSLPQNAGKDFNIPYERAIQIAAEGGEREALRVLLESALYAGTFEDLQFRRLAFGIHGHCRIQSAIFFYAARSGREEVAREALEKGADPLIRVHEHAHFLHCKSVIDFVASKGLIKAARMWLQCSAEAAKHRQKLYWNQISNALMLAVRTGRTEMAQFLIENGADVNAPGRWMTSLPLVEAARRCQPDMVRLLLENGADIRLTKSLKTKFLGESPVQVIVAEEMKKYIDEHGMTSIGEILQEALAASE